jgi:peptidylprolyl isomerase
MKGKLAGILAISLVLLTGCGDKEVSATADNLPTVTTNQGEAPTIGAPSGTPPTTLVTKDIIVGEGAEAQPTSTMTVHYTLMTWSNGALIESSWNSGSPATFPLAKMIVGWQQGIPGMKVGGRRLLVIPPDIGYGAQGSGPIGANETLIFVVDAIGVA